MDLAASFLGWIVTVTLIVTVLFLAFILRKVNPLLPPGPFQWPIIGNLPDIFGKDLHVALTELGKKYGDFVWMKLGSENVLVVNSIDATMDSFVKQGTTFAGRPAQRRSVEVMLGEGVDIVMNSEGSELKFHRRIVHSFLASQQKSGKCRLNEIITQEAESLIEDLSDNCRDQKPFDPKLQISRVVANVICQSILNKRFQRADEKFYGQLKIIQDIVDNLESFNIVDLIPWLESFPIPSWVRFKQSLANKDEWVKEFIKEHRDQSNSGREQDLLDILLELQESARADGDQEKLSMLSDKTIGHIVYELFGGGIESTTMTILWFLVYMVHNPQWQDKVAAEVQDVSSLNGGIFPEDKSQYPCLEAVMKETLRLASILPVGFPHKVIKDTRIGGYDVPKDTMVIMNIWAIHHDENTWLEPYKFNPDRFLERGEKLYRRGYIPFGIGRRVCLGSRVAKMEIFMFCAHILSHFKIEPADKDNLPDTTGRGGLTMRPNPFNIVLTPRHLSETSSH